MVSRVLQQVALCVHVDWGRCGHTVVDASCAASLLRSTVWTDRSISVKTDTMLCATTVAFGVNRCHQSRKDDVRCPIGIGFHFLSTLGRVAFQSLTHPVCTGPDQCPLLRE